MKLRLVPRLRLARLPLHELRQPEAQGALPALVAVLSRGNPGAVENAFSEATGSGPPGVADLPRRVAPAVDAVAAPARPLGGVLSVRACVHPWMFFKQCTTIQ